MGCVPCRSKSAQEPSEGNGQASSRVRCSATQQDSGTVSLKRALAHAEDMPMSCHRAILAHAANDDPLPEYARARAMICVAPTLMARSMMLSLIAEWRPSRGSGEVETFQGNLERMLNRAYNARNGTTRPIFRKTVSFWQGVAKWRQPVLTHAVGLITERSEPSGIIALLDEVEPLMERCQSAKNAAFNRFVLAASGGSGLPEPSLSEEESARARVLEIFDAYVDLHKRKAYASAFLHPAMAYWRARGNRNGEVHVEVHGTNWYLALVNAGLGVQLPELPAYGDTDHFHDVVSFWQGGQGMQDAWEQHFSRPEKFGQPCMAVPKCKTKDLQISRFPDKFKVDLPKDLANRAARGSSGERRLRQASAIYLERFAHFFTKDFFVRKAFETCQAEEANEAAFAGFSRCCDTLFEAYCRELPGVSSEIREAAEGELASPLRRWLYDEHYMEFSQERCARFLAFLGLLKPVPEPQQQQPLTAPDRTCVVCMETRDDVHVPPHVDSSGDISGHLVCSDCLQQSGHHCPMCRMIINTKPFAEFVDSFVSKYETRGKCYEHPDEMAETIFQWQALAMDITDPRALSYVTTLVLTNETFKYMLHFAVKTKSDKIWARDAAGVIVCLLALVQAGLTRLSSREKGEVQKLLEVVLNKILKPFEQGTQKDGNYLGALYTQALGAWQVAISSGFAAEETRSIACRVVRAIVRPFSHLHVSQRSSDTCNTVCVFLGQNKFLIDAASPSLWSQGEADPMLATFQT
eukprot:CAMPEP_0179060474 /NCGR_PEP_ID=MMETSP0796-20121207/25886_1 /TAXON_ID=73915 /ORGANISM="Pyrodinium bahamense, Strain pbaha01" /LENGTH=749 /DNA_ID=CAMNT_0020757261 /DNA_START=53 /DNA_END=2302 /DNA_ORIENTATION=-